MKPGVRLARLLTVFSMDSRMPRNAGSPLSDSRSGSVSEEIPCQRSPFATARRSASIASFRSPPAGAGAGEVVFDARDSRASCAPSRGSTRPPARSSRVRRRPTRPRRTWLHHSDQHAPGRHPVGGSAGLVGAASSRRSSAASRSRHRAGRRASLAPAARASSSILASSAGLLVHRVLQIGQRLPDLASLFRAVEPSRLQADTSRRPAKSFARAA